MTYQQVKKSAKDSLLQKKQSQMAPRAIDDNDVQTNSQPPKATISIPSRAERDAIRKSFFGTQGEQIQTKLTIGQPGDKYEQEADRVAAQVVNQINAPMSSQPDQSQSIQRETMPEEDELQMKAITRLQRSEAGMTATPDLETSIQQARGSGQSLANNIRQPMEQAFGADFSGVKVHTDAQSHQLNQSIQAKAFTTGQDIFFRQGQYNPGSRGGQELLAHELTHVVQQNGSAMQLPQSHYVQEIQATQSSVVQRTDEATALAPQMRKSLHKVLEKLKEEGFITVDLTPEQRDKLEQQIAQNYTKSQFAKNTKDKVQKEISAILAGKAEPSSHEEQQPNNITMDEEGRLWLKKVLYDELEGKEGSEQLVRLEDGWYLETKRKKANDWYVFATVADKNIQVGKERHWHITRGRDVLFAGEVACDNGEVIAWSNRSGHYKPPSNLAQQAGLPMDRFVARREFDKERVVEVILRTQMNAAKIQGMFEINDQQYMEASREAKKRKSQQS